jgi:hypothetical protein
MERASRVVRIIATKKEMTRTALATGVIRLGL